MDGIPVPEVERCAKTATKNAYLKGRVVKIYVSTVPQRAAGSLRHGEGRPEGTPCSFEFSWVDEVP